MVRVGTCGKGGLSSVDHTSLLQHALTHFLTHACIHVLPHVLILVRTMFTGKLSNIQIHYNRDPGNSGQKWRGKKLKYQLKLTTVLFSCMHGIVK